MEREFVGAIGGASGGHARGQGRPFVRPCRFFVVPGYRYNIVAEADLREAARRLTGTISARIPLTGPP